MKNPESLQQEKTSNSTGAVRFIYNIPNKTIIKKIIHACHNYGWHIDTVCNLHGVNVVDVKKLLAKEGYSITKILKRDFVGNNIIKFRIEKVKISDTTKVLKEIEEIVEQEASAS